MVYKILLAVALCICMAAVAVAAASDRGEVHDSCHLYFKRAVVQLGSNIGMHVQNRVLSYLETVPGVTVERSTVQKWNPKEFHSRSLEGNLLVLSLGNTSWSRELIEGNIMNSLPSESFHLSFRQLQPKSRTYILASDGTPLDTNTHRNVSFDKLRVHYGALVGAYAALEELGFAFLHPLEPHIPSQLAVRNPDCYTARNSTQPSKEESFAFSRTETPYWPERGFHLHTQHPLELTEVLQGHDIPQFGPHGPMCKQHTKPKPLRPEGREATLIPTVLMRNGSASTATMDRKTSVYCERWEDMVTDVDYFFEWAVANRLNKVEWLLLGSYKWGDEWATRHGRLRTLTSLGHQYSLLVGADVPLGNVQQHGWHIVNMRLPFAQQTRQIRERVDWVLSAGFDLLTTESGLSEFTHPECDHMLELMNIFAEHVNVTWGREAAIKVRNCAYLVVFTLPRCSKNLFDWLGWSDTVFERFIIR
jgi:hypothetical protein